MRSNATKKLERPSALAIGHGHRRAWRDDRVIVLRGALSPDEQADLREFVEEVSGWPETPGAWMKYFEGDARQLCRAEDFIPYHAGLRELFWRSDLMDVLAELFGEPAVMYKEKINYKLPGGQAFVGAPGCTGLRDLRPDLSHHRDARRRRNDQRQRMPRSRSRPSPRRDPEASRRRHVCMPMLSAN